MRTCNVMSILCQTGAVARVCTASTAVRRRRRRIVVIVVVIVSSYLGFLLFVPGKNEVGLRFGEGCRTHWADAWISGLASRMCMHSWSALDHPVQGEARYR
jgi:hypothetical protein